MPTCICFDCGLALHGWAEDPKKCPVCGGVLSDVDGTPDTPIRGKAMTKVPVQPKKTLINDPGKRYLCIGLPGFPNDRVAYEQPACPFPPAAAGNFRQGLELLRS
jgi:hypothetical protein